MTKVAVVSPFKGHYSETFIHDQVQFLSAYDQWLTGGYLPTVKPSGELFSPIHKMLSKITSHRPLGSFVRSQLEKKVGQWLMQHNIDVVLAHYGPTGVHMARVCQTYGIPLVVHFHGYDVYRGDELERYSNAYNLIFQQAAALIAVSKDMVDDLLDLGAPFEKIAYNPCGVNPEEFPRAELKRNPPDVLFVGRLEKKKRPELAIRSFAEVVQQIPEARMKIIGSGVLEKKCKQLVRTLHLQNHVDFQGAITHHKVKEALAKATVFYLSSGTDEGGNAEGTPVAALEASAAGLPLVASNHKGLKDAIVHQESGYLVNENATPRDFAKPLISLLRSPNQALKMGRQGMAHIRTYFSQLDRHKNLYQILTNSAKSF